MAALAAGFGAAMAGGSNEANAQATEIAMTLDSGTEIVINVADVPRTIQEKIFATLEGCLEKGTLTRDECVAGAAKEIAQVRLDAVVRKTQKELLPLETDIGLTPAELIQEPAFCYAASSEEATASCVAGTEEVQLAAAEYGLAAAREGRIAAETREAELDQATADAETREITLDRDIATTKDTLATTEAERDAYAAVLAALRRVAAGQ